jgi:hypothetical protein
MHFLTVITFNCLCVGIGVLVTHAYYRDKIRELKNTHTKHLNETATKYYRKGWDSGHFAGRRKLTWKQDEHTITL